LRKVGATAIGGGTGQGGVTAYPGGTNFSNCILVFGLFLVFSNFD